MQGRLGEATGCRGESSGCPQCTGKMGALLHKVGSLWSLEGQGGLEQWREVLAVLTMST